MNIKLLLNFRYLLHSSSTVVGIFSFTDNVFLKYDIPWENCTSLEVEDTFGNVGRHNYHSWQKYVKGIVISFSWNALLTQFIMHQRKPQLLRRKLWITFTLHNHFLIYYFTLITLQNTKIFWQNSVTFVIRNILKF